MMNKMILMLCAILPFISCKNDKQVVENKPESVVKAWQAFLDISDYESAMTLSSPEATQFVKFLEELEADVIELDSTATTTIIKNLKCEINGDQAICNYVDEFGREDHFDLIKINEKWLVHLLLDEALNPDLNKMLEDSEEMLEEELEKSTEGI